MIYRTEGWPRKLGGEFSRENKTMFLSEKGRSRKSDYRNLQERERERGKICRRKEKNRKREREREEVGKLNP